MIKALMTEVGHNKCNGDTKDEYSYDINKFKYSIQKKFLI